MPRGPTPGPGSKSSTLHKRTHLEAACFMPSFETKQKNRLQFQGTIWNFKRNWSLLQLLQSFHCIWSTGLNWRTLDKESNIKNTAFYKHTGTKTIISTCFLWSYETIIEASWNIIMTTFLFDCRHGKLAGLRMTSQMWSSRWKHHVCVLLKNRLVSDLWIKLFSVMYMKYRKAIYLFYVLSCYIQLWVSLKTCISM